MSTRATIILTYQAGNTIQMYHHCDGYPEYMGKLLESFCKTAFFMRYGSGVDTAMYNLLKMEKHFEIEERGFCHGDIEYIWYVTLREDGFDVSYTDLRNEFDTIFIDDKIEKLLKEKSGKTIYA
jgi:hypothetical protein